MTDQPEPAGEPFVVVPTLDAWNALLERLDTLEGQQPAADDDDQSEHARLDRHRAELEAIKRAFNALVSYVRTLSPDPGSAPEQLQPAPTVPTSTVEEYQ